MFPHSVCPRILGCLTGIATGDAIGKQTETLSRADVRRWYPNGIRGFEGTPGTPVPRYVGNRKHEWRVGETTDDTEGTIAVARAILQSGNVHHADVGRQLLRCTKSIHPGVSSLWEFHQTGDPQRVTDVHDGCGAAIRVASVGIVYSSNRFDDILTGSREASVSTHGGPLALAAAAATAAAVSAAIDGASPHDIIRLAERAASEAERRRTGASSSRFAEALHTVHAALMHQRGLDADAVAARWFPQDPLTIVPLAIALGTIMHSAEDAILVAANVGGDSDSVASIAGGILGARCPETINNNWHRIVEEVNRHDLVSLANSLAEMRR